MAKQSNKIPTAEELDQLAAEESAKAAANPAAGAPFDFDGFCFALAAVTTSAAAQALIEANAGALTAAQAAALEPPPADAPIDVVAAHQKLVDNVANVEIAIKKRLDELLAFESVAPIVAGERREFVVRHTCYPVIFGNRVQCMAGETVSWTPDVVEQATAQGVVLDPPKAQ